MMKSGTLTFCWDFHRPWPRGTFVHRWGKMIRSWRVYGGPFAVAFYRMDDYELVAEPHDWSE